MNEQTPASQPAPLADLNDQIAQRLLKLQQWRDDGVNPFGGRFDGTLPIKEARALYREGSPSGPAVCVAGRITNFRLMGKSVFADVRDGSERIQVYTQLNVLGEQRFQQFKRLDLGDIVGVRGELFLTRMGELTIKLDDFQLLSKALRPLPDKHSGLADVEQRHRQRYLDLISNDEARATFLKRIAIIREIRRFLEARGFLEVETPMMQPFPGGAAARPFETFYNALDSRMYMRIAPELYLKRLLVGGLERVFELNRNFRNEGLSRRHNPEFTMLEVYQAYSDCRGMMDLVEEMVVTAARNVLGTLQIPHPDGKLIDLSSPWRRVAYHDLVRERFGQDWFDLGHAQRLQRAKELGHDLDHFAGPADDVALTQELYEKVIEPTLIQPTFVTRVPRELVPLANRCADDPSVVDVYELEINGQELSPGYSELNDPLEQRRRFEEQLRRGGEGTEALEGKVDEDFLLAQEHGMPPAGGMGLGIDRLVMLLTGAQTIRDVILFPQLRPR